MDEDFLALMVDLHKARDRQGPGGDAETAQALALTSLDGSAKLRIADIGCGTGASTLPLARSLDADIAAVDFLPGFIDVLTQKAEAEGLSDRITALTGSMEDLPFTDGEFDLIWSEGAIYNMGFENGVTAWQRLLKPGGMLVVSEITWITGSRPAEIQEHWESEYPEIATASSKIAILERSGYTPVGYFILPEHCWLDNYYDPLDASLPEFLARHDGNEMARTIADAEREESALYRKYSAYFSYGMYVARKNR